jgi:hypothetical protein
MFLHRTGDPAFVLAIPQVSHAWLAWQVAQHWGNRRVARPAPRAEVLASVLLHDVGWTEFDVDPGVDRDGRLITFDRMPLAGHLEIWRASVRRAAMFSRYTGLLVANRFRDLVDLKSASLIEKGDTAGGRTAEAFRAEMDRLLDSWRESLRADARYGPSLDGEPWEVNTGLLEACDKLSVCLCAALGSPFSITGRASAGGPVKVTVSRIEGSRWRMQPWPLEGDRLKLQVEGHRLGTSRFADGDELHQALARAPVERLTFTLQRPAAG